MKTYSIQNQSCLLDPVTGSQITGDRIYCGDTVAGEWYDTGNEILAPRIVAALNNHDRLVEVCRAALEYLESHRPKGNIRDIFSELNAHENGVVKPLRAALAAVEETENPQPKT